MVTLGLTTFDIVFTVAMLTLFVVLLVGILFVMARLSRHDKRLKMGQCPRCGGEAIERRPYLREGECIEDSKHVAWYCTVCSRVVHIGSDRS